MNWDDDDDDDCLLVQSPPRRGSLVGCRLWVAQSRTRLKRLSSSSSLLALLALGFVVLLITIPRRLAWSQGCSLFCRALFRFC